jgi:hypothetical protein
VSPAESSRSTICSHSKFFLNWTRGSTWLSILESHNAQTSLTLSTGWLVLNQDALCTVSSNVFAENKTRWTRGFRYRDWSKGGARIAEAWLCQGWASSGVCLATCSCALIPPARPSVSKGVGRRHRHTLQPSSCILTCWMGARSSCLCSVGLAKLTQLFECEPC